MIGPVAALATPLAVLLLLLAIGPTEPPVAGAVGVVVCDPQVVWPTPQVPLPFADAIAMAVAGIVVVASNAAVMISFMLVFPFVFIMLRVLQESNEGSEPPSLIGSC